MSRLLLIPALLVCLTGCASGIYSGGATATARTGDAIPEGGQPEADPRRESITPAESTEPRTTAATTALMEQSRTERNAGDLGAAAATIERALAIAPEDALLWVELAEIRFDQGDRPEAREMARKALTLTADNTNIARRARELIER